MVRGAADQIVDEIRDSVHSCCVADIMTMIDNQ